MRHLIFPLAALVAVAAWNPLAVRAAHDSPLYEATDRYRDAVKHFEDDVRDAKYFNRYDEKLVDRLEDATSHLRSAARNLDHLDRLFYEWEDVQSLQPRVERAIFGRRCYPPHPQLTRSWNEVLSAYDWLVREMQFVRSRPFCTCPEMCNGQCGYHPQYQSRFRFDRQGAVDPDRYDRQWDRQWDRPGAMPPRERGEVIVRRDHQFDSHDRDRVSAVPHVDRHRVEPRDVGAAIVGSLVRSLLRE